MSVIGSVSSSFILARTTSRSGRGVTRDQSASPAVALSLTDPLARPWRYPLADRRRASTDEGPVAPGSDVRSRLADHAPAACTATGRRATMLKGRGARGHEGADDHGEGRAGATGPVR